MPQSLANVLLHIVFSTKHRQPFLRRQEVRDVMTGYLIGTLSNLNCPSLQVGVVEDHVHLLCNLHRTLSIAKLVEELKTSSSARIKDEGADLRGFHWQNGYGVFSVSQSNAPQVKFYVANQEEHHRRSPIKTNFVCSCSATKLNTTKNTFGINHVAARWASKQSCLRFPRAAP